MEDQNLKKDKIIPEYESSVRRVLADAHGTPYYPLKSLEEARKHGDAVMVMEGDYGGQIYVVSPVNLIKCSEEALKKLLEYIDNLEWPVNEGEGAGIYYERKKVGEGIAGGMGGGRVEEGIWVHPRLLNIKKKIESVLKS